jgi:hypothetical protein
MRFIKMFIAQSTPPFYSKQNYRHKVTFRSVQSRFHKGTVVVSYIKHYQWLTEIRVYGHVVTSCVYTDVVTC